MKALGGQLRALSCTYYTMKPLMLLYVQSRDKELFFTCVTREKHSNFFSRFFFFFFFVMFVLLNAMPV